MKSSLKLFALAAIAATALSSCSSEEPFEVKGEGTLRLSATINSDVKPSRANIEGAEREALINSSTIWISSVKEDNKGGVVRKFNGYIPTDGIKLLAGHYVAEVWAGDSVPASFDKRYFKGRNEFDIQGGAETAVKVNCTIANSVVQVTYPEDIDKFLSEYKITVGLSQGQSIDGTDMLTFVGNTTDKGYFMTNSRDKDLTWTISGKMVNGTEFTRKGTIKDCKPATLYSLNVKSNQSSSEVGGTYLVIEVDEETIDINESIEITSAPTITGYGSGKEFDINEPQRIEKGKAERVSVFVAASSEIESAILKSDIFATKLGISGNDFDFMKMPDNVKATIEAKGINYIYTPNSNKATSTLKINFEDVFLNSLDNGEYDIDITITDTNYKNNQSGDKGKSTHVVLKLIVSDAPVVATAIDESTVYTNRATITGEITKDNATNPILKYREADASRAAKPWITAQTTVSGKTLTATITGLKAGTTYEYTAGADNFEQGEILRFTTEAAAQFPNSSFENWCKDGKSWVPAADLASKFWDSGNYGATTIGEDWNITTQDNRFGNSAACLKSTYVLVKFAAGNIFIGKYLATDGTDGVLGWGRTWSSRPTKLKGLVRYEPVNVTSESKEYSALKKGDLDKGIIYIALLDNTLMDYKGEQYPQIIKTKASQRTLFNKDGANVIAYGEIIFDKATEGDGLVEFEIPLTYKRPGVKPSYIMCTASASIGGDYFVGGDGSTMWLDDLELIYE